MADKIPRTAEARLENFGDQLDDFVAHAVTVNIVEGLEVIEIAIRRREGRIRAEQPVDLLIDRHVAGQQGERIRVARCLHLEFAHQPQQIADQQQAAEHPLLGDQHAFGGMAKAGICNQVAGLMQAALDVQTQHVGTHDLRTGLVAEQIADMRPPQAIGQHIAVEDSQRAARRVDNRNRHQVRLQVEAAQHLLQPA
ncbi:hypothetical protein GALL_470770 [mine drainage metagenome]|uniref:Uncharacterized protein n=1 Tax=mine drainage metagenome TaxID=410659 RepID=A0A1J5PIJ2_9ZZZZ